jgi:trans-aconitate methyltransferase
VPFEAAAAREGGLRENVPMANAASWDARTYDAAFGFVAEGGADLVELLDPRPGERVLDLGCGTGRLTAALAEAGAEAVGVDADPAMIARAREQFPELRFELADGERLDSDPGRWGGPFDAVFSNAALHWMTRPEAVLRGVAALVRPGGRFVAELGAAGNIATIEDALRAALVEAGVPRVQQPSLWYFPSPAAYTALLERHGFELRALWHFERPTPLDGGEARCMAAHVRGAVFRHAGACRHRAGRARRRGADPRPAVG